MKIEVSNGEIIDKLTIICIKMERIRDAAKLSNLKKEHDILAEASLAIMNKDNPLYVSLYKVNSDLWDIEDRIRGFERRNDFGKEFVAAAREVYRKNDLRSGIKREINLTTSSGLIEEKSYEKY